MGVVVVSIGFTGLTVMATSSDSTELKVYPKRNYIIENVENPYAMELTTELNEGKIDLKKSSNSKPSNLVASSPQIDKLANYLEGKNAAVFNKTIAAIIVNESKRMGADYRIVVAIMGKESGFCKANYKKYNCFGYLNGVQYSSFEQAFRALVPKVAAKVAKTGWNIRALADLYRPVDRDGWAKRVYALAVQVP